MNWFWASHAHAVMHGDDLVVLDTLNNDYFVLPRAADLISLDPDGWSARVESLDLLKALSASGLGGVEPIAEVADRRPPAPATADLYDEIAPSAPARQMLALGLLSARVSLRLSTTRLANLVHPPPAAPKGAEAAIVRSALVLRRALPWLPFQGACVYRAALLRAALGRLAGRTRWIFSVSTWPFAAHCWVQLDDLVLNDRLQRVRRYTPILSV